jgi:putative inorganic carbon (HCO3(-)) transporter
MLTRAVWRPRWWVWALLGLTALAAAHELTPSRLRGHWLFITPLAILAGVLVVRRLWELPPATTMCAAIVLTIFSGAWHQIGLGGLPFDRLLIVIVLLQFLLGAPGIAHTPPLRVRNVHLLMCLTIIYVLTSAAAAGTLTSELSALSLLDQFGLVPFIMFFLAPSIFSGKRERNMLLATLVGVGAYLGFTAIFESLGPHALVFPRYILRVDTELPGERAGGPFQSSVAEGFATFGCAVAAVIAFAQWEGQRRRYLAALVAVVCIFGCFVTLERGVWIGALAGTVVAALVTRTGRRWLIPGLIALTVSIGGALVISSTLEHKTSARVEDQRSLWDRQNQVSAGLRMLQAKPLFGFGWDSYASNSLEYFRQAGGYPMEGYSQASYTSLGKLLPLHELYLAYAVELGLVGALLWLASVIWGIGGAIFSPGASALRPWKLGLLAIAICYFVIALIDPVQAPFSALLLWTWAGVALGSAPLAARPRRAKTAARTTGDVVWTPA